jgi:hypothetical protein
MPKKPPQTACSLTLVQRKKYTLRAKLASFLCPNAAEIWPAGDQASIFNAAAPSAMLRFCEPISSAAGDVRYLRAGRQQILRECGCVIGVG